MYPKVKFKLDKTLDKKICLRFLELKQGGIDFSRGIINIHPKLKEIKELKNPYEKRKKINDYFNYFYKENGKILNKCVIEFSKKWQGVERNFLEVVLKIFKNHPFPKGKYIGYLSIINCNPRFLEDKTFQVFYLHPLGVKYLTSHELLHFIFYDYVIKKYPKLFKNLDAEKRMFWNLSEVFNAIILNTPEFIKLHGVRQKIYYPEHLKYLTEKKKMWQKYRDINGFIMESYKLLRENRR